MDFQIHTFKANKRGKRYLIATTIVCLPLVVLLLTTLADVLLDPFSENDVSNVQLLKSVGISLLIVIFLLMVVITIVEGWMAYRFALNTQVVIDPIKCKFMYSHNGETIEFYGKDVDRWLDCIGLKIGFGRLTRLTLHDSVMILKSGKTVYLHSWLWDGDYSWLHTGGSYEHNIKFYLESHQEELNLPECKTAWTYNYMFNKG